MEVEKRAKKRKFKKEPRNIQCPKKKKKRNFKRNWNETPELKICLFESLTPGRQRGYFLHFPTQNNPKTEHLRIEKCMVANSQRKGLNELIKDR